MLFALLVSCSDLQEATQAVTDPPALSVSNVEAVPMPPWTAENLKLGSDCGGMFDYCISVRCDVTSIGKGGAVDGTAILYIEQEGGRVEHKEALSIGGGSSQSLRHDFTEARAFGGEAQGGCSIQHTGSRVTCDVRNRGGPGGAQLKAVLTLKDGTTRVKQQPVSLGKNETQTFEFKFDEIDSQKGHCELI